MTYKIKNENAHVVEVENERGEIVNITLDVTDIARLDGLFALQDSFATSSANIERRTKKAEKEYADERVLTRQLLRITREELSVVNKNIDELLGEGTYQKIFLGSMSPAKYKVFFDMLEKEFEPAMKKAQEEMTEWDAKYSVEKDDDVL
ncbi:hypothetical protein G7062_11265 [Erysipelothrix sp. HDW6C]|uniref:hypothetical protein n=1 Tax=Erysipelothrix sp. HDW6C TaxID=2714930 RepID=UPI001407D0C2|nr:hypothetical protein [Erysipelothrix sp. HDW6C]QIK70837.1 hypothetical protein G7062_11265 [Erysipelothrix sp. HDW6C]